MSSEEAAHGYPAVIRGVVTATTDYGLFVQDASEGIWTYLANSRDLSPGDLVEITGTTAPGLFSPVINGTKVQKLGHSALPRPKKFSFSDLASGKADAQYATVEGEIRSVSFHQNTTPALRVWVKIAMDGESIYGTLPEQYFAAANKLIGAQVRISAPVNCTKNLSRQLISSVLMIPGLENIQVLKPPPVDLYSLPLTAIGRLLQYRSGTDIDHRVRVAGTVTYYDPGNMLIIERDHRALLVFCEQRGNVQPGDQIEVVGFPTAAPAGPYLRDVIFRYSGPGQSPTPTSISASDLSTGTLNYNLVSTQGTLLSSTRDPRGVSLLLQSDTTLFRARLSTDQGNHLLDRFRNGSVLRVSGISVVDVEGSWNLGGPAASVVHDTLLLRSADDVQEIRPPSWWSTTHLMVIAGLLGVLVLVFCGFALMGRVEQWRLAAVLEERERLAHEIHDTLAQSFAGIGFQIQALRRSIPAQLEEVRQQADLALSLVRHSHKEAHRAIAPMTLTSLQHTDLLAELEASALRLVQGGTVAICAASSGPVQPLPAAIADALLLIGLEAIANAVRHAEASRIDISIVYFGREVELTVSDDGMGFVESGDLLGFGLRGIRKRAAAIHGTIDIMSAPGKGTSILVNVKIPPKASLSSLFKELFKIIVRREGKLRNGNHE